MPVTELDHTAFPVTGPGGFIRRFQERGIDSRPRALPEVDLYRIFLEDPNGSGRPT